MSLLNLPIEIWDLTESHLVRKDLQQLCQTCRAMMMMLQTRVYSTVTLDETAESGRSMLALMSGPRARFVRSIRYSPHDPKPILGWDGVSAHDESVKLSHETREVLRSLRRFENLKKFRFILDKWDYEGWPTMPLTFSTYAFADSEDCREYVQQLPRDQEPWRILLEQSLLALSNSAGAFCQLDIANLPPAPPPVPYLAVETAQWKTLLQQITSLDITLGHVGSDGLGNMTVVHQEFLSCFQDMFLQHVSNIRRLRVAGHPNGAIGYNHILEPIKWGDLRMPYLKTLELEYSQFEGEFVAFIARHAKGLERVYLRHCFSVSIVNWQQLCGGLVDQDSKSLIEFRVVPYPALKLSHYSNQEEWDEATDDMWLRLREDGEDEGSWEPAPLDYGDGVFDQHCDEAQLFQHAGGMNNWSDENSTMWEKEVIHEGRRRFVVAYACDTYGAIETAEVHGELEDEDLDESSVVKQWEKVDSIIQRNNHALG